MPNYTTITGTFKDGSGNPLSGNVSFTPSQTVYFNGVPEINASNPLTFPITGGVLQNCQLLATDNAGMAFEGLTGFFFWTAVVTLNGLAQQSWQFFLPSSPATVDLYKLAGGPALGGIFLPLAGGTLTGWMAPAVVALTDAATIAINAAQGNVFSVTLGGNRTLGLPSNPVDGQQIRVRVFQPSVGGPFTLAYNAVYDFGATGAPVLSTTASKGDELGFEYWASKPAWVYLGSSLGN